MSQELFPCQCGYVSLTPCDRCPRCLDAVFHPSYTPSAHVVRSEQLRAANNRAFKAEAHVKRLQDRIAKMEREAATLRKDLKEARLACAAMREHMAQMVRRNLEVTP